ncbi:Uncharacterised protein [Mycobacteroides abscessus subsp. abscessus]|nr:Uncharacterised protein [Mycobacteroides abscessus subsp. abscessus]
MHGERRVVVGGGPRVFEAAALIDSDVDEHRARLHLRDKAVGDEHGCLRAGDEHRTDHEVGLLDGLGECERRRVAGVDASAEAGVDGAKFGDVEVEDGDLCAHSHRDGRGVDAADTSTDDDDVGGFGAGDAAHQHAAAAFGTHEVVGAHLGSESAGDLAHRGEQGQRAVGGADGLVGDRRRLGSQQRIGARAAGREVQVGEDRLALAHESVLGLDRLFDLEEQVGLLPDRGRGVEDLCARGLEVGVVDGGPEACTCFDDHVVAALGQLGDTGGRDGDAVFVVLDLCGDADTHRELLRKFWGGGHVVALRRRCSALNTFKREGTSTSAQH